MNITNYIYLNEFIVCLIQVFLNLIGFQEKMEYIINSVIKINILKLKRI